MSDVLTMLEWLNATEAAIQQAIEQMPKQPAVYHDMPGYAQRNGYAVRLREAAQKQIVLARVVTNGTDFKDHPEMLALFPDPLDLQSLLGAIDPALCSGTTLDVLASDATRLIDDWLRLPTRLLAAFRERDEEYDEAEAQEAERQPRKQRMH